jgi:hypothetical protein
MIRIQSLERLLKNLLFFFIIFPGSLFAGKGVVQIASWFGYQLPQSNTYFIGFIAVAIVYLIPKSIRKIAVLRKIELYFPITAENIKKQSEFFLSCIDMELNYLSNSLQVIRNKGMHNDFLDFGEGQAKLTDIREKILTGVELQIPDLIFMNQVFNKKYLLKILK